MKQGPIEVLVKVAPAVSIALHPLLVKYAQMMAALGTAKMSKKKFNHLKLFLTEYCDVYEFQNCSSLQEVVNLLKERSILCIFNVETLIVCRKCKYFDDTSTVKKSILEYKEMLNTFLSNTSVKAFVCSLESQRADLHGLESVILKLKLDDKTESCEDTCTLKALKKLAYHFFGKISKAFILSDIHLGCLCITWLVPMSLVPILRIKAEQLSREYLASQGVLELVIGLRLVPNEG